MIIQSVKYFYFTLGNKEKFCVQCRCSVFASVQGKHVVLEQMRLRTIWQPTRCPGDRSVRAKYETNRGIDAFALAQAMMGRENRGRRAI